MCVCARAHVYVLFLLTSPCIDVTNTCNSCVGGDENEKETLLQPCLCACMYVCMYVRVYVCMYVFVYDRTVWTCVYLYVYIRVYVRVIIGNTIQQFFLTTQTLTSHILSNVQQRCNKAEMRVAFRRVRRW